MCVNGCTVVLEIRGWVRNEGESMKEKRNVIATARGGRRTKGRGRFDVREWKGEFNVLLRKR